MFPRTDERIYTIDSFLISSRFPGDGIAAWGTSSCPQRHRWAETPSPKYSVILFAGELTRSGARAGTTAAKNRRLATVRAGQSAMARTSVFFNETGEESSETVSFVTGRQQMGGGSDG